MTQDDWTIPSEATEPTQPLEVTPHLQQFLTDYKATLDALRSIEVNPLMGMGEGDLTLSIVSDAYAHHRMAQVQAKTTPVVPADELTLEELEELDELAMLAELADELGQMPIDNS